jgi:hypothetical protein
MASTLGMMVERWRLRRLPLACPTSRFCVGFPAGHWARWSLPNEVLQCTLCGGTATAEAWRIAARERAGGLWRWG